MTASGNCGRKFTRSSVVGVSGIEIESCGTTSVRYTNLAKTGGVDVSLLKGD